MSDLVIYGPAMSTFVRSARMTCAEKGVPHRREDVDFRSVDYRALQPFNRVPAMRHGDFTLYETAAMVRYVDRAFPGPALQPTDLLALARMEQWISATMDYIYETMIRQIAWERLLMPMSGSEPDEAKVAAAVPALRLQIGVIEKALGEAAHLAGDAFTLADIMLFPILDYLKITPEGADALAAAPRTAGWIERVAARPSVSATDPARD
jgi:glutathione S-transferase